MAMANSKIFILSDHKICSLKMVVGLISAVVLLSSAPVLAGSKWLSVAFVDYSANGVGKASFKALRASEYQDKCWQNFVEIEGIETAYIDKVPSALDQAARNPRLFGGARSQAEQQRGAEAIRQQVEAASLFGVYIFVPDANGKTATIYGIGYQQDKLSRSKPVALPGNGLIDKKVLSKRLCEASKVMD